MRNLDAVWKAERPKTRGYATDVYGYRRLRLQTSMATDVYDYRRLWLQTSTANLRANITVALPDPTAFLTSHCSVTSPSPVKYTVVWKTANVFFHSGVN